MSAPHTQRKMKGFGVIICESSKVEVKSVRSYGGTCEADIGTLAGPALSSCLPAPQ